VLETSLEENLAMISDSISYLRDRGRRVFFDAEHFFDGYNENPVYALQTVRAAANAGAECVVLCDTNGGTIPGRIAEVVQTVRSATGVDLGIHTHNDAELAVAGALAAVDAGVKQVQGTVNGYGERCGNANLLSIIANLKIKKGVDCISDEQLATITEVSRFVSEIANMPPVASQPYVGTSAFAHKGGLHVAAVAKVEHSYQHIAPVSVGNDKRVLVSELSGRGNIMWKVSELGLDVKLSPAQARALLEQVKLKESEGFQYEGAEASFELLARRAEQGYKTPFELVDFMTMVTMQGNHSEQDRLSARVTVKVTVNSEEQLTAAEGNGPVNALDNALRKALMQSYPELGVVRLVDFKVRVVDQGQSTGAVVRVLIESTDGKTTWNTVGASPNIIEASWMALSDSLEYWLVRNRLAAPV
jgi:2-isopropylmalate synthase